MAAHPVVRTGFVLTCLLAMVVSSGCGYALAGRGSFLPDYIRTVGVPPIQNKTPYELDVLLTDAVRREFAGRGRYTVLPETTNVDAVLTGTITDVRIDATGFTSSSQASRQTLVVRASFEFRDLREDKVLWSNPSMEYREQYDVATAGAGGDVAALFGQNTTAMQRLAQSFSRSVVSAILEAF